MLTAKQNNAEQTESVSPHADSLLQAASRNCYYGERAPFDYTIGAAKIESNASISQVVLGRILEHDTCIHN